MSIAMHMGLRVSGPTAQRVLPIQPPTLLMSYSSLLICTWLSRPTTTLKTPQRQPLLCQLLGLIWSHHEGLTQLGELLKRKQSKLLQKEVKQDDRGCYPAKLECGSELNGPRLCLCQSSGAWLSQRWVGMWMSAAALMAFAGAAFGSFLLCSGCHFQEDLVALPAAFLERGGSGLGKCWVTHQRHLSQAGTFHLGAE